MSQQSLKRELGLFGATLMGLGSIVGSGVFVSIGVAAGVVGPAVILAIGVAAFVATCNALSSAQLAASHPVSGGTYEYGYRYLNPRLGFMAAWLFLLAKSASAATAALGFAGYTLHLAGTAGQSLRVPLALGAVLVLTLITLRGVRRSNTANTLIVSVTLATLVLFVLAGWGACALMFVAYTGYGRIATLGEEVTNPRQTIPRAILSTLVVTMVLYLAVACVAVGTVSPQTLSEAAKKTAAPLEAAAAATFNFAPTQTLVALGAITAMLGVLLNLILGLSRVLLAMGRRGDMPKATARINETLNTPSVAVVVMGAIIALLVLTGNVRTTWSFSAFNVLLYYAITNLAALRLPPEHRLYPRFFAYAGLGACAFLAFWVEPQIWAVGLGLLALGWLWQTLAQRLNRPTGA